MVSTIESIPKVEWDFEGIHYFDKGPLTVQYLFVLDALNFCFWPGTLWFFLFLLYAHSVLPFIIMLTTFSHCGEDRDWLIARLEYHNCSVNGSLFLIFFNCYLF